MLSVSTLYSTDIDYFRLCYVYFASAANVSASASVGNVTCPVEKFS